MPTFTFFLFSIVIKTQKRKEKRSNNLLLIFTPVKNLLLPLLIFCGFSLHAQFSAYDPFDDNSNGWLTRNDDTASFVIQNGKLDMNIKAGGDYVNAKGAKINQGKLL